MKSLLLPFLALLPLLLAGQTIPHQINVLDIQPDGADKEILEVGALGGKVFWSVTGDVNYLSSGTLATTTSFPGGIGFRSGLENLGNAGDLYYFYYAHQGKGYYAEVDGRLPAPRPLRFPLLNKDGYTYTNPVMSGGKIYVIRDQRQSSPARHVRQILELNPATEGATIAYADTLDYVAEPDNGRLAELDGHLYFTHFQGESSGPATYAVASGTVTDLGVVTGGSPLAFHRAGNRMLLSYTDAMDRPVSRLVTAFGSEAEHATALQASTAVALESALVATGTDGKLYAADYTSGNTTLLVAGSGAHPLRVFQVSPTEVLYARPIPTGEWVLGRTDGTPGGTRDVVTIPSVATTGPQEFAMLGEFVAFLSANHPLYLFDLGSEVLQEVAADCSRSVADPGLGTIGDRLYFAADHPDYGREIHYLTIPQQTQFSGTAFRDDNGNGTQESGEPGLANIPILVDGGEEARVYTDSTGRFTLLARHGDDYSVTTDAQDCYHNTSSQETYAFTYSVAAPPAIQFAFQPEEGAASLYLKLNSGRVRCNTEVPYWLTVYNDGCLPAAGTATITLPENVTYLEAEPAPATQNGRELTFTFDTLQPGQSFYTILKLKMPDETFAGADIEVGAAAGATTATGIQATVTDTYTMPLRCAIDPNDKLVSPSREEPSQSNYTQLDEAITYTLRFQNTGNDTAFDVRLEDQLSHHLDLNTFRPLAASHPYTVRMLEGGNVIFRFDNIFLPDSNVNLVGSEGFVSFEIKARQDLPDFTVIENTAAIYFDFNKPVITNTVRSTMVEALDWDQDGFNFYEDCDDTNYAISPDGVEQMDSGFDENCDGVQAISATTAVADALGGSLKVYPNPAGDWLHLEYSDPLPLQARLVDATGRELEKVTFTGALRLATADYPAGVYLLKVSDTRTGASTVRRVMVGG
ncbi:putative repeat protein (TIGR01451 family) [Lewinella marina]|uniref:DUF7619 domain-containing protein n=1 Tax=Neolewinella marina TaxID=438751 RepID=A0A2G0CBH7_9BACT|nr:T9SS type A sorting domain-containing protein [Neolewinella marina]NJB87164.1 putative repeat protein (TIGR01451 family) [Neolewinella marina]PHK97311.1 hypothetical protein CGL56_16010 [Neolewinella marina]